MSIESISQNNYVLATQQAVTHDESMSGNGTVESPLSVVPGYNETVLWSGSTTTTAALNEDISHFERVKVAFNHLSSSFGISEFLVSEISGGGFCPLTVVPTFSNNYASVYTQSWNFPTTTSFSTAFKCKEWWGNNAAVSSRDSSNQTVVKIWGINRKA